MLSEQDTATHRLLRPFMLLMPIAEVINRLMADLQPELNYPIWLASFFGAFLFRLRFSAGTWRENLSGLLIGYLLGVYGGTDLCTWWNLHHQLLGHFLGAFLGDLGSRFVILPVLFTLTNPAGAVDFVSEKGTRLVGLFGSETFGRAVDFFSNLFSKK